MNNDSFLSDWITSPYYSLYYRDELEQRERFLKALITKIAPAKNSKILEVGCGTGKTSELVAQAGFDVTGVDFSFKAISEAKVLENENLHFFQHDIRLPFWMNYFDYVFSLFNSFGRYVTLREHQNAVRVIAQSLKPGGLFILDYFNSQHQANEAEKTEEKNFDNLHFETSSWIEGDNFYKKIKVTENGFLKDTFIDKSAKFTTDDFSKIFASHNLEVLEVFGDYEFNNFEFSTSLKLIILSRKNKS